MPATNILPARPAQFDRTSQHRRSMIGKIQIAKGQIGITDDDYRQALFERTGKLKTNECSDAQLVTMIKFMESKGFRPLPRKAVAQHPMAKKARALWISLYHLGEVPNPSEQALEAFAKRQLKCEKLVWARQSDGYKLIEALKSRGVRHGWLQHNPATQKPLAPRELQAALCHAILARLKSAGVIPEGWALHEAQWKLCGIEQAGSEPTGAWTAEDYQRLAGALGAKLREFGGATIGSEPKPATTGAAHG